jgi:hypothetical protein
MIELAMTILLATASSSEPAVLVAPDSIDLGVVEVGAATTASVWLLNTGTEPVGVSAARPSCGCVEVLGFERVSLIPRLAQEVRLRVAAPKVVGTPQTRQVRFAIEGGPPVALEVRIASSHPLVEKAGDYLAARERGDKGAETHLAPGARFWFGGLEGPGRPLREPGPWAGWDEFFGSELRYEAFGVSERTVTATAWENNDFYRLIERPETRYRATFWFDERQRIEKLLLVPAPKEPRAGDRLAEFLSWADREHPGAREELMPEGRIDPDPIKARRWKTLLERWRRDAGLEPID